jgi:hypothetical protein
MCDSTNITLDLSNGLIRHASFRYSVYTVQISTIDLFCSANSLESSSNCEYCATYSFGRSY